MSFVFLCALPPEAAVAHLGLRRSAPGRRRGAVGGGHVRLVGMGPLRSRKAASRLASVLPDDLPVVVLGVGGALVNGLEPGDLVVANALGLADVGSGGGALAVRRDAAPLDARSSAFSDQVASALSARFPSTRQAALLSAGRTAKGSERLALGSSGAVICDTESYWLSRLADRRPFAVVRAIVDTPERELFGIQTVTGGIRGLGRLREAAALIAEMLAQDPILHSL